MRKDQPLFSIRVKLPPGVAPGHIPVPLLLTICGEAQKAVSRQAEALEGRERQQPGRVKATIARECTLELIGLKRGSTALEFAPVQRQQVLPETQSLSIEAVNGVAKTLKGVAGKLEKADAPDPGVLDALDELGKVFESGVEKLQFIVPGIQGQRRRVVADFDPKILPKIRARKQDFRLNGLQSSDRSSETAESSAGDPSSEGSVLEGMLDALDGKVRISPAVGRATTLSFGPDKAKEVYEALHKPVKVRIDPGTHKVKDIQITLPYLSDESGFFARQTIEQLIDQQHVRPMTNLEDLAGAIPDEDVEQMIAEVYRERESPI